MYLKMELRNMCLLLFHSAIKHETANTASANVTSLLITLPALDDQAKYRPILFSCTSQPVYNSKD